jgi:hypothetical protein
MARRVEAASVVCVAALCGHAPPPRQKVCKVLETKDIRLDFGLTSYAKSKSPACAGLGFFSDLSIAAVSMVSRPREGENDCGDRIAAVMAGMGLRQSLSLVYSSKL